MIEEVKKRFLAEFGSEPALPEHLIIDNNCLFTVSEALSNTRFGIKPLSAGLLLSLKDRPCQALLEMNKDVIKNYIILNDKSSFLFTCNRKILKKGIIEKKGKGYTFAAFNERREVIGIIKYADMTYNNVVNIGYYLLQDNMKRVIF